MLVRTNGAIRTAPAAAAAVVIAISGSATILGAYFFQYGLGLQPCPLCLEQRIPYYVAIPLALIVAIAALRRAPRRVLMAAFAALALVLIIGAGLGIYHAGIEWHWWAGPQDCSGGTPDFGPSGGLLNRLNAVRIVRCDEAPWRFLGLSLAGYNALISAALACVAAWGLVATAQRAYGSSSVSQ